LVPLEQERRKLKLEIKNNFLQRVMQEPLDVVPDMEKKSILRFLRNQDDVKHQRKCLKQVLLLLHIHPCYLIGLYKKNVLDTDVFLDVLKEIYPTSCISNSESVSQSDITPASRMGNIAVS